MKLLVSCFTIGVFALAAQAQQTDSLNVVDTLAAPAFYLTDVNNPKKMVKIDPRGTVVLVKYDKEENRNTETSTEDMTTYSGTIDSLTKEQVYFSSREISNNTYQNFLEVSSSVQSYYETPKKFTLNIKDVDGMYYSSRRREMGRNVMFSVLGISAFTALIVAPLASLEYRKTTATDGTGFDRKMYFGIAGAGLLTAAVSFPIIYLLRPKYYSFQGDNYAPSKRRWALAAQ